MTGLPLTYSALLPLEGVVRDYSWGSPTAIPQLLGRPPTGAPAAELWLGAHPRGPAMIVGTRRDLASVIAANAQQMLGPDVLARFGAELPYLMKVIAPAKALGMASILFRGGRHRRQRPRNQLEEPDAIVTDVVELERALKELLSK